MNTVKIERKKLENLIVSILRSTGNRGDVEFVYQPKSSTNIFTVNQYYFKVGYWSKINDAAKKILGDLIFEHVDDDIDDSYYTKKIYSYSIRIEF